MELKKSFKIEVLKDTKFSITLKELMNNGEFKVVKYEKTKDYDLIKKDK